MFVVERGHDDQCATEEKARVGKRKTNVLLYHQAIKRELGGVGVELGGKAKENQSEKPEYEENDQRVLGLLEDRAHQERQTDRDREGDNSVSRVFLFKNLIHILEVIKNDIVQNIKRE